MTEWEQIKKEYRETEIPKDGPRQVMEAMARAKNKKKKTHLSRFAGYGAIAAAALLILLLPTMERLFMSSNDNAYSSDSAAGNFETMAPETACDVGWADSTCTTTEADTSVILPETEAEVTMDKAESSEVEYGNDSEEKGTQNLQYVTINDLTMDQIYEISSEILRQMQERMTESEDVYYIENEQNPDGFERISEEQTFYINKEGQLVVVFAVGEVAPDSMGAVEFVIPKEIYSVKE